MNESRAIAVVEEAYGSLEDLVYHVLSECPEVLEGNLPLDKTASLLRLDPGVSHFLLTRSNRFRMLIRADLVNREFDLMAEGSHIHEVVKVATNAGSTRMTAKGELVEVDHNPADIMSAGKYLNDYRGTSIQPDKGRVTLGVQVNFIGAGGESGPIIDVEAVEAGDTEGEELHHHRPSRAGDLPPTDARERYALADGRASRSPRRTGDEFDFYSPEAEEAARDSEYEARTRSFLARQQGDGEGAGEEPELTIDSIEKRPQRERDSLAEKIRKMKPPTVRSLG